MSGCWAFRLCRLRARIDGHVVGSHTGSRPHSATRSSGVAPDSETSPPQQRAVAACSVEADVVDEEDAVALLDEDGDCQEPLEIYKQIVR